MFMMMLHHLPKCALSSSRFVVRTHRHLHDDALSSSHCVLRTLWCVQDDALSSSQYALSSSRFALRLEDSSFWLTGPPSCSDSSHSANMNIILYYNYLYSVYIALRQAEIAAGIGRGLMMTGRGMMK